MKIFRSIIAGLIIVMTASLACAQTLYKIESVNSGKVLDVPADQTNINGVVIQQWDWNGGLQQQWTIQDVGNGLSKIVNARSGKVLDVLAGQVDFNGISIQQWDWIGGTNQQWSVQDTGGGNYIFVRAGTGYVLDVEGASPENGARIQQWGYWGGAQQQWRLIPVGECLSVTADSVATSANPVVGTSYEVYANNVQNAIRVLFPTWTDANGQDELIWYEGVYDAANNRWKCTVNLSEHNNENGSYTTHVYAIGTNGGQYWLGATNVAVANAGSRSVGAHSYGGMPDYRGASFVVPPCTVQIELEPHNDPIDGLSQVSVQLDGDSEGSRSWVAYGTNSDGISTTSQGGSINISAYAYYGYARITLSW